MKLTPLARLRARLGAARIQRPHPRLHSIPAALLRSRHRRLLATLLLALVAGAGIFLVAHAAEPAGAPGPDRLHRQVGVMEGIIDKVLYESPNFLVAGRDCAGGVVLPDYGVVFSFAASLNSGGLRFGDLSPLNLGFDFDTNDDGAFIVRKRASSAEGDSDYEDQEKLDQAAKALDQAQKDLAEQAKETRDKAKEARDQAKEARDQLRKLADRTAKETAQLREKLRDKEISLKEWQTQREEKDQELYAAGKQELMQVILDYGETLAELKDGQWIILAGFFDRGGWMRDKKASRLVLRAKIDDLRAYSAGRLTESAARDRVIVEEY